MDTSDKPMWSILLPIIIQEGIPAAEYIWQKWSSGAPPTQADWDGLKELSRQTAKDRMTLALARYGISATDPRAAAFTALAGQ